MAHALGDGQRGEAHLDQQAHVAVAYVVYADALHARRLAPALHLVGQEVLGHGEQALVGGDVIAHLDEAVGLTEGAVRHYESGIRAVKPELLESIAAALGVSVNALKDYGVETAGDLMSLLVRLEDSFGIVPAADGTGLSLNPKAPRAPKAAMAIEL